MNAVARIDRKIVGFRVKPAVAPPAGPAIVGNPITKRIPKRPDGFLEGLSCKLRYTGQDGEHVIYFVLAFMPVSGVMGGEAVTIERPAECFIPPGQRSDDQQWIAGLMRVLSKAARNGMFPEALAELREVVSPNGGVQLNWTPDGHNKFHDSLAASVAFMMQQALVTRGFLDEYGRVLPIEKLVQNYAQHAHQPPPANLECVAAEEPAGAALASAKDGLATPLTATRAAGDAPFGRCPKPQCQGQPLKMMGGCRVCPSCSDSSCS